MHCFNIVDYLFLLLILWYTSQWQVCEFIIVYLWTLRYMMPVCRLSVTVQYTTLIYLMCHYTSLQYTNQLYSYFVCSAQVCNLHRTNIWCSCSCNLPFNTTNTNAYCWHKLSGTLWVEVSKGRQQQQQTQRKKTMLTKTKMKTG